MRDEHIKEAIAEAERFLAKAKQAGKDDDYRMVEDPFALDGQSRYFRERCKGTLPATSAAIRRSSLDLTKALAKMRQG